MKSWKALTIQQQDDIFNSIAYPFMVNDDALGCKLWTESLRINPNQLGRYVDDDLVSYRLPCMWLLSFEKQLTDNTIKKFIFSLQFNYNKHFKSKYKHLINVYTIDINGYYYNKETCEVYLYFIINTREALYRNII